MAESVAVSAAKLLGSVAWREVNQLRRFDRDLDDMQSKLVHVGALLHDAGEQSLEFREGEAVRIWLRNLRSVACDIQDVLGDYQAKTVRFQESTVFHKALKICSTSNPLLVKRSKASNIKELKQRLYRVADDPLVGRFNRQTSSAQMQVKNERFVPENIDDIVGRKDDILKVKQLLEKGQEDGIPILPIVGIGGVGKTTTARIIFEEAQGFDLKIWVTVTRHFNWNRITRSILEVGDGTITLPEELNQLIKLIEENLGNKKCMFVLDDLWNEGHGNLEQLKKLLQNFTGKGSQVIVTTRNTSVARIMCNITRPYKLKFLCDEDSWNLFSRMAFSGHTRDVSLKEVVGRKLLQKCRGLPLLVRLLGSKMGQKETYREWRDFGESDIWALVAPSLKLSYYYMPPEWRQCFQYCAVLPEDFKINKQDLLHQWVALGMAGLAEAGEYLRGLMDIHFLLDSNESTQVYESEINEPQVVCMHHMVHQLAKSIADDFVLVASSSEERATPHYRNRHCRHAELSNYNNEANKLDRKCLPPKTRALHLSNCNIGTVTNFSWLSLKKPIFSCQIGKRLFKAAKYLQVLDLSGCSFEHFPRSVCDLKYLRYLCASGTTITKLPKKFTKLGNLLFLDVSNTSLKVLPSDFCKLRKLLALNLSGCGELIELPEGLGESGSIEFLDLSSFTSIKSLPKSTTAIASVIWQPSQPGTSEPLRLSSS